MQPRFALKSSAAKPHCSLVFISIPQSQTFSSLIRWTTVGYKLGVEVGDTEGVYEGELVGVKLGAKVGVLVGQTVGV